MRPKLIFTFALTQIIKCYSDKIHQTASKEDAIKLADEFVECVIECCAQLSEDYVARNDQYQCLTGQEVADCIAHELRDLNGQIVNRNRAVA